VRLQRDTARGKIGSGCFNCDSARSVNRADERLTVKMLAFRPLMRLCVSETAPIHTGSRRPGP
jgi:hypothetical protein